ncbi:MAG: peptide deformylase [Myxococcota bacterium]
MALEILKFPDPRLREKALEVTREDVDDALRAIAHEMGELMYAEPGIGLAATQVGVNRRLIVMDLHHAESGERNLRMLLNPEIVEATGDITSEAEACLSVPDYSADVPRRARVRVRARTLDWEPVEFDCEGIESICFQHEIDHLDGILYIDRISKLKRDLYVRKRRKQLKREREEEEEATVGEGLEL